MLNRRALSLLALLGLLLALVVAASAWAAPSLPTVQGQFVSEIGGTNVTVQSLVKPGEQASTVSVLYATEADFGTVGYTEATTPQSVAGGAADDDYHVTSTNISGLSPNITYHAAVEACNASGCVQGEDFTFEVDVSFAQPRIPEIFVQEPSSVTASSATISTWLTHDTSQSTVRFFYDTDAAYQSSGNLSQQAPLQTIPGGTPAGIYNLSFTAGGLTPGVLYRGRIQSCNIGGCSPNGVPFTFTSSGNPPSSISGPNIVGYQVTPFSAAFTGQFNPNGMTTQCTYDVVSETDYLPLAPDPYVNGSSGACNPQQFPDGATGTNPVAYQATAGNLQSVTDYHLRVCLESLGGTVCDETTFATIWTSPAIDNLHVTDIDSDSGRIVATIDPHGKETRVHVEWGTDPGLGSSSEVITVPAGAPQTVSFDVGGPADSAISYQLWAENQAPSLNPMTSSPSFANVVAGTFKTRAPAVEPQVGIIAGPRPNSASPSATFTFNKSASVARTECQVDDQILFDQWVPCESGYTVSVAAGDHQFNVRGVTSDGKYSQTATYYWTTLMPSSCQVQTLRARTFIYTGQDRFRMVERYTARKKIKNVTAQFFLQGKRGKTLLGSVKTNFKKAGVVRIEKNVSPRLAKQLRKGDRFQVQLRIPGTTAACTTSSRRVLDVEKQIANQRVMFQHDVLFTPQFAKGS